jgi:hypothetical protein
MDVVSCVSAAGAVAPQMLCADAESISGVPESNVAVLLDRIFSEIFVSVNALIPSLVNPSIFVYSP